MVTLFWKGVERYKDSVLVDFNGRGFDIPLLTLSAFRFGISCPRYFSDADRFGFRYRFTSLHIDLQEWLTEYGAYRIRGGLNLLAKVLGKPGKMTPGGGGGAGWWGGGAPRETGASCTRAVLDPYFLSPRPGVLPGETTRGGEHRTAAHPRLWLEDRARTQPALQLYIDSFGAW